MSDTRLTCTNCQRTLKLREPLPPGTKVKCPGCRAHFVVPGPADDEPEIFGVAIDRDAASRGGPPEREERSRRRESEGRSRSDRYDDWDDRRERDHDDRGGRRRRSRRDDYDGYEEEGDYDLAFGNRDRKRRRSNKKQKGSLAPYLALGAVGVSLLLLLIPILISLNSRHLPIIASVIVGVVVFVGWLTLSLTTFLWNPGPCWGFSAVVGAGVLLGALGITALITWRNRSQYLETSGLLGHLPSYRQSNQRRRKGSPELIRKPVILESGPNAPKLEVSDLHFQLADDLMPESQAEVGTIVFVHFRKKLVGRYDRGGDGYQWQALVQLVDYRQRTQYYTRTFTGTSPPQRVRDRGDHTGSKPTSEVMEWVNSLPQKSE